MGHPFYNDDVMLNMVRHTIHLSLPIEGATAAFMILHNWKGISSAIAYMQILRASRAMHYLRHCSPGISDLPPTKNPNWKFWIGSASAPQCGIIFFGIIKYNICCLIGIQGGMQS